MTLPLLFIRCRYRCIPPNRHKAFLVGNGHTQRFFGCIPFPDVQLVWTCVPLPDTCQRCTVSQGSHTRICVPNGTSRNKRTQISHFQFRPRS